MNLEQRMQTYDALPPEMKVLYSSESAAALNRQLMERFSIPAEMTNAFLDATGDVILGFNKISDLPRILQQQVDLSADDAQRLTSQLIEFLGPVVAREEAEAKAKQNDLKALAEKFANKENAAHQEESVSAVEPIRTMEGDMNRVHGYGAYRELYGDEESNTQEKGRVDK